MAPETPNRYRKDLAKQIGTYADATTAFAVLQSITFSFSLGSDEVHKNVLKTPPWLIPVLCIVALAFYVAIIWFCYLGESALIGEPYRDVTGHKWRKWKLAWRTVVTIAAESAVLGGI